MENANGQNAISTDMEIETVEIHEFTYRLEDVGTAGAHQVYSPGEVEEPPGFVLTIRAANGLEGHYRGFVYTPPMVTQIKMAAPEFLLGRDALEREGIWQDLWHAFRHTDHLGIGPIDVALWDLAGKYYETNVASLLGGYRDEVPAYASTSWSDTEPDGLSSPDRYAEFARECADANYPAFKIHPVGDPRLDIEICRAVADEVGEEIDLMLDPASAYDTYVDALRVGRVLDECGFLWYEDPMADTGESIRTSRRLARDLDTMILGGEHVRTGPFGRADHLADDALDILRADAHLDGGITSVMKIANLAEAFGVDVELHLGGPAHLHCMSAIRNTNYYEHGLLHPQTDWIASEGFTENVVSLKDGRIAVPEGPGLGVDIDWEYVNRRQTDHVMIDERASSGLA